MKQLTQELKSGKMEIMEVPFPALNKGSVMVRNHYSVISAGTEGKTVTDARKGYLAKAQSRQKEVKQVIDMVKTNGLMPTYKLVMNKLEAPSALGYSTAGEVIAVADDVTEFKVGDRVACGGVSASHADVVCVPKNLCVKVPENVDLKHAAFTTIASIAVQGIRQADLRMGENCLIIGMGLIGQMTSKILSASGIRPIGVDVSDAQVEQSKAVGIQDVYNRNTPGIEDLIMKFSNGSGVDSVIITAGTSSLDPVELAGAVARKKAKVVIVGAVPTGFNRANYYKKELDLRMSMSYGPGRQDPTYEDKGIDYPIGYVRWTENRNMQSYLELIAAGKLDISGLISHTFKLEEAPEAYNMILSRSEAFNGVVIQYEEGVPSSRLELASKSFPASEPNVGMIGAGNFAQGTLLPNMKDHCNFVGVATGRGNMSKYVGEKYKFNYCAESASEVFEDKNVNTIVITTRHDSHAEYVIKGIEAGKHVFVEKPLAMNEEELESIREAYNSTAKENPVQVMVGFNRRFAPPVQEVKKLFVDEQPKSIMMRINAGVVPPDHWVNDPKVGGGRIIGEGCHFIDLAMYLAGNKITAVSASAMQDANGLNNTVVVNLEFANGSVASVSYFSNGSKSVAKEYIEVFCGQTVAIIDDFRSLTISGGKNAVKKFKQDKGHAEELKQFFGAIKAGRPQPISFEDCYVSSLATLKVLESIRENRKILL
ncbi:MAG: bi-domain-containing oxidoreductase [Flavobacteriales bacterium]|nr:bi-domain-containing oxidoreductase [Flavobacteriales bacterium]